MKIKQTEKIKKESRMFGKPNFDQDLQRRSGRRMI